MLHTTLLVLSLHSFSACDNAFTRGDTLYPQDTSAMQTLATLPRDNQFSGTLGILFTTQVFANASAHPLEDADSALAYLDQAQKQCPESPIYEAYWCVARMLRVVHRKQHETQFIFDTIRVVFARADSLVKLHPKNRSVQFLIGCIFQNASPMVGNAQYYWGRSQAILSRLDAEAGQPNAPSSFYTPEIRANIRLNLAHLSGKGDNPDGKTIRENLLREILQDFPNTLAAQRASTLLTK